MTSIGSSSGEHMDQSDNLQIVDKATRIVEAYVSRNRLAVKDLPALISDVHEALDKIYHGSSAQDGTPQLGSKPAVSIGNSITPDHIICLEDGKEFKSLKRHLRTHYGLSPEEYREKWGLPRDYPMVAPNYARERSALAKKIGLGRKPTS